MNPPTRRFRAGAALLLLGLSLILAVNLTASPIARATPGVLYAAPTAQGSGDCSSWDKACTLQTALAQAQSGDEIWVQAGVHYPGTGRTDTFTLKNGVALYGGFAGTETSRDARDWQTHKTILSGDIDKNDNHGGDYINENASQIVGDNAYHVVTGSGTDSSAVLDGFFITAGQANGDWPNDSGGGMYNDAGSPTLTNVTFSGNSAYWGSGGGMYNSGNPTLTHVTFSGNSAHWGGGGIYNTSGNPTLTNVTFSGNSAAGGGGMANDSSNPTLTNVTFSSNSAAYYGGGMYNSDSSSPTLNEVTFSGNLADVGGGMYNTSSSPTLTNVTFSSNSANVGGGMYNLSSSPTLTNVTFSGNSAPYGGGMVNDSSSPTLTNVTFSGNSANERGGGMYNYWHSSPTLTNITFSGNTAYEGGGMYNYESSPTLTNITFSGNSAGWYGGGMYNAYSSPTLTNVVFSGNSAAVGGGMFNNGGSPTLTNVTLGGNSATAAGGGMLNHFYSKPTLKNVIIWADTAPIGSGIYNQVYSTPLIAYSDIQGCGGSGAGWNADCGTDGGGNIDADPRFVDAANGNLRLRANSPCIDAGDNTAVPAGVLVDLAGSPRFVDIADVPDTGFGTPPIVDMGAYETQNLIFLPLVVRN